MSTALALLNNNDVIGWCPNNPPSGSSDIFIGRMAISVLGFSKALSAGLPTTPVLQLDQATASAITGIKITSAASGSGVVIDALGGTNETLTINAKGSGSANHVSLNSGAFRVRNDGLVINSTATTWSFTPVTTSTSAGIIGSIFSVGAASAYGFSSNRATTDANDSSIYRLAAGVVGIGSGGASGSGWFQNTAGLSRVKTSDVTTVSVTPAAITGLSATTIAGRGYSGELVLFLDDATATDGIRIDFDGGAGTWTSFVAQGNVTDTLGVRNLARTTAIATDLVDATTTGSAIVIIKFSGVANAAGTFIPRIAKSTDAAGATLTVRIGGYMKIDDMP